MNSYFHSPALDLVLSKTREDLAPWDMGCDLVMEFVNRKYDGGCLRILCEHIERSGNDEDLRRRCGWYLRYGITLLEHNDLEVYPFLTPREMSTYDDHLYYTAMDRYAFGGETPTDDPAIDKPWLAANLAMLPPSEWSESIDYEDLIVTADDLYDPFEFRKRKMPRPGAPTNVRDLSLVEALQTLRVWEVCSEMAVLGIVTRDMGPFDAFLLVLCKYIDAQGVCDEMGRYISRKLEDLTFIEGWQSFGF
jgi:hypothetical protein